jgi:hypothetical protein
MRRMRGAVVAAAIASAVAVVSGQGQVTARVPGAWPSTIDLRSEPSA